MGLQMGGIEGVRAGTFSPDRNPGPTDFAGLHTIVQTAVAGLTAVDRETCDMLGDSDTQFSARK